MNRHIYNAALLLGVILVGTGVGLHDIGAGLAVSGALLLALTLLGARIASGSRG